MIGDRRFEVIVFRLDHIGSSYPPVFRKIDGKSAVGILNGVSRPFPNELTFNGIQIIKGLRNTIARHILELKAGSDNAQCVDPQRIWARHDEPRFEITQILTNGILPSSQSQTDEHKDLQKVYGPPANWTVVSLKFEIDQMNLNYQRKL